MRVCQFRHSCVLFCVSRATRIYYYIVTFLSTSFLNFFHLFSIKFYLTISIIFDKISMLRGGVGTGRRARLRILWEQSRVGSSPILRSTQPEVYFRFFYCFTPRRRNSRLPFTVESRTCCAITTQNTLREMGFAHRRRRFLLAKPVTITARRAVNSNNSRPYPKQQEIPQADQKKRPDFLIVRSLFHFEFLSVLIILHNLQLGIL